MPSWHILCAVVHGIRVAVVLSFAVVPPLPCMMLGSRQTNRTESLVVSRHRATVVTGRSASYAREYRVSAPLCHWCQLLVTMWECPLTPLRPTPPWIDFYTNVQLPMVHVCIVAYGCIVAVGTAIS